MRHIVIVSCPALKYFSTLSHKRQEFRKKVFEIKICILFSKKIRLKMSNSMKNLVRDNKKYTNVFM